MSSAWFEIHYPRPEAALRLYCFPYAGASALLYRSWGQALPDWIEVRPVQYPGRWSRYHEPLMNDGFQIVEALSRQDGAWDRPFVVFGHSMGGFLAFELNRRLQEICVRLPEALIVSAVVAPDAIKVVPSRERPLSDAEILERIRSLGGTPENLLNHPEMRDLILPVVRADLNVVETYRYVAGKKLPNPIFGFAGDQDPEAPLERMRGWSRETENKFQLEEFAGGHFFLSTQEKRVLEKLESILKKFVRTLP